MGTWIFSLTFVCLALISGVSCLTVVIPEVKYEYARGDNITLPCNFKSNQASPALVIITWTAEGVNGGEDVVILTHYSSPDRTDYTSTYEKRAKLDVNTATGKADLRLYSISLDDNRRFVCRVQIPGDDEGIPADTTELVVLVAPSPPICKVEGKAEYGQNINLTCRSEEGSPPPTYKWDRRSVENIPKMNEPRTTDKGGILSLYNISKDTSGYYICTSANKIRSATCNLTLAVMPPSMLGSVGQTAGIIAAVVAALIIFIIVIYCCCCKKKGQDEEYTMGVKEYRDNEPAENGERRAPQGDARTERDTRERRDYDDPRSDYDDRRSDYTERRTDYDDRRSDFSDRRSDYDDRRSDYTDRTDDRRDRRYDDDRRDNRYDDDRRYDSRDRRYDDREYDDRPAPPANKPPRRDYDDD
ncbi:hypothetical protein NL108_010375 [Boleophthalmus pectinirostris]|uniref:cell surface A33 antigen-like n=1 Tax=Boleophthalmus pectinirostris TaxID=150288 RepID=UPI00242E104F|nr:cell surface A33 antigen-like [Boleophthalmus pectinirostris]KAJ0056573.1 hypothetical protein NL108_010375 [Boleophthalmus pectinirostris]